MLGFLMFLTWFVLSIPPLGRAVWKLIKLYRDEDRDEELLKRAHRSLGLTILWAVLVIVGLWALAWLMDLRVESLWFADAGYAGRFWTQFNTELVLYWIGFVLAGAFCFTNVTMIAKLNAGSKTAQRVILGVGGALSLIAANVFGSVAEGIWQRLLLFLNGQPFGKLDPVFKGRRVLCLYHAVHRRSDVVRVLADRPDHDRLLRFLRGEVWRSQGRLLQQL